jgi:hypothetical protein
LPEPLVRGKSSWTSADSVIKLAMISRSRSKPAFVQSSPIVAFSGTPEKSWRWTLKICRA